MGFPVGYSEFVLPKFLLHLVFLLWNFRQLISCIFESLGLGDLIAEPEISTAPPPAEFSAAKQIEEMLPVVLVKDLEAEGWEIPESCAVCLQEFAALEEIRRPWNCRHIYHRSCIDRWMSHDQRTCPLCRTLILPQGLREASPPAYLEDDPTFSLIHQFLASPFTLSS